MIFVKLRMIFAKADMVKASSYQVINDEIREIKVTLKAPVFITYRLEKHYLNKHKIRKRRDRINL